MASSADVWTPRDSVPIVTTDTSIVTDRFTAVAGQVDFTLVQFSYKIDEGSLLVVKNGVMLDPFLDFSETSNTTFRLTTAATAGDKLLAIGFIGAVGNVANRYYLGAYAVEPTVNGYGVALSASDEGVTYWNTATKDLWLYNGTAWILAASSSPTSANLVNIADTGGHYVGTEVETALAEAASLYKQRDIVATGTVDAITATFSPAITLTDKTEVTIIAIGANTVAAVTFNPNGLGAKSVKKFGNQPIAIGDIYGAGHAVRFKYNLVNDVWELMNPIFYGSDVTGYVKGATQFIEGDVGADSTAFDVDAVIGAAWESIGPTGSGATNIWTALDKVPATAKYLILQIFNDAIGAVDASIEQNLYLRKTGSATGATVAARKSTAKGVGSATKAAVAQDISQVYIPIDSSRRFDAYLNIGTTTSRAVNLYLVGWG